jgi:type I restriction enzyme S subunit
VNAPPQVRLADESEVITKGTTPTTLGFDFEPDGVPFVRAQNLVDGTVSVDVDPLYISDTTHQALKRSQIMPADVLISIAGTIGRAAIAPDAIGPMNCNQAVAIIRPSKRIDRRFLLHWFSGSDARSQIAKGKVTATISNLSLGQIGNLSIPLPPLDEQRRIAAILDKADALRRKRKRAIELLDALTLSIFLEMFGDPVSNPKGIPFNKLGNVASFVGGGTPSKSAEDYWNGTIPWVSPKDMKVLEIFNAEDHVSDKALCETSLRLIETHSVLLVVRGMILAHTVPLAITRTSTTINQDMKAIQFQTNVNPVFGLWCLLAQHDHILTKVSSAAHGTKRLDMDDVERFPILLPSDHQQALFLSAASKVTHNRLGAVRQSQAADALFSSLQHRAFSGGL